MNAQENGKKRRFSIPTLGCEGCEDRKAIIGAGNWKLDAAIFVGMVAVAFIFWKVKVAE